MKELFLELPNEMYDKAKQEAKRKNMKVLDYIREQMMKKVGYEKAKNEPVIPNDNVKLEIKVSKELYEKAKEYSVNNELSMKEVAIQAIAKDAESKEDMWRTFAFKLTREEHAAMREKAIVNRMSVKEYVTRVIMEEIDNSSLKASEIVYGNQECSKTISFNITSEMYREIKEYLDITSLTQQNLTRSLVRKDLMLSRENQQEVIDNEINRGYEMSL